MKPCGASFENPTAYDEWAVQWRIRLDQEPRDGACVKPQ